MKTTLRLYGIAASLLVCASGSYAQPTTRVTTYSVAGRYRVAAPTRWRVSSRTPNALELFIPPVRQRDILPSMKVDDEHRKNEGNIAAEATMLILTEPRRSHNEALRRLEEIAAERPEPVRKLLIGGWPAIERTYRAPLPVTGDRDDATGAPLTTFATTAIADGATVVRFETTLQPDADAGIADEALSVGRSHRPPTAGRTSTSRWELDHLRAEPKSDNAKPEEPRAMTGDAKKREREKSSPGVAVATQPGRGELEVVVTVDGQNVLVAANPRFSRSSTSGVTWTATAGNPCNQVSCDGDPSLAVGQSGTMYFGWIGGPSANQRGNGISRSADNGQTFPSSALAVNCPGSSACTVADQEHIAADRFTAGASGDRVYNVWRNFTGPSTLSGIRIVCSSDGGSTWGTQLVIGAGDFPRVAVGPDGFVYVASRQGGNMMLTKFTACDASNNLTMQAGFPVTVAAFNMVSCPVSGLDRCNSGNILSSPTVAADELDPKHLYYAFATQSAPGNENIILRDSTDGGATFPRSVQMNAALTGRRFMPWVSSYGGVAAVSWYDRRFATAAQNDSTRFFIGTAKPNGPTLTSLTETDLSGVSDQQCSTWPCAPRAATDATSCNAPQLAGRCSTSGVACDFNIGCPAPQTCDTGNGCPKYGDYNGNAAAAGRLYSAWATAVAPSGTVAPGAGINVYNSVDRIPSDFFIRDWTTNATTRDFGIQPSTNPDFWASGDVWNQSTGTVAPLVNDWIVGDQPTRTGPNFVFARVSRRAAAMPAAPDATGTVRFAFADFGLGVVFTDLGTEDVTFNASDLTKFTAGHSWSVPATASAHLCMVAQLTAPDGDDFAPPSIVGLTPSAGIGIITADNNKAQRNLEVAEGTLGGTSEMFAMVRNDHRERRMMRLRITAPGTLTASVAVAGGKVLPLEKRMWLDIGELGPGEIRWVQLRVTGMPKNAKMARVDFADDVRGGSGFTIGVATVSLEAAMARNIRNFANVLIRLAELQHDDLAASQAKAALELTPDRVIDHLRAYLPTIEKIATNHLSSMRGDPAGVAEAVERLRNATDGNNAELAASALNALTERLDVDLSMIVHAHPAG